MQCIRGVYASASLKLWVEISILKARECIRGVYASASLKLDAVKIAVVMVAVHPRCLRLGLIEA